MGENVMVKTINVERTLCHKVSEFSAPPTMAPKHRKSLSSWFKCEACQSIMTHKSMVVHTPDTCPPSSENWSHGYIKNATLFSTLEECPSQDFLKNVPKSEYRNMVFLSQSAMQLCNLCIGDLAVVITREGTVTVKTAWPTHDGSLTSVFMTRDGLEASCAPVSYLVVVEKLQTIPLLAQEVHIMTLHQNIEVPESLLQHHFVGNILSKGCKFRVAYYGKIITFEVKNIKPFSSANDCIANSVPNDLENMLNKLSVIDKLESEDDDTCLEVFFKVIHETKWCIQHKDKSSKSSKDASQKKSHSLSAVGGLSDVIDDLQKLLSLSIGKQPLVPGIKCTHGILLYGPPGVGKTMLVEAFAAESVAAVHHIHGAELYSRFVGEAEAKLRTVFDNAKQSAPCLIILDELDVLCPRRSSGSSEQERRIVVTLATQLDKLADASVVVIATTSHPDSIDAALRRPGRIDREVEIPVPTPNARADILHKMLGNIPHTLRDNDIEAIAQASHGFVGADLAALCSRAALHSNTKSLTVADMSWALTQVKPSAMREALVHIPNVQWSDVGGQHALKLQLQQAVEWPLKHPDAFRRLGIKPPRGVLLFGPPGCSKTLIAKALATESKLNFISIKGPELFSKWVGESERAVREVFRKARQVAPAIVFLDELDAVGSERAVGGATGGNSVQERVVAQLLTELDGVEPLGDVTILAATNRPDRIDKALLRPGRLDRVVYVPLPDYETRSEILSIQLSSMPVDSDVNADDLAGCTEGYSGAELVAVCQEAALTALEHNLDAEIVTKEHFDAALNLITPRTPASLIQMYERYLINTS